jgi:small subunit ribosomal protein S18
MRPRRSDKKGKKKKIFYRKKVCRFCENKIEDVDYKDIKLLRNFVTERGKIIPRRISGTCAPHQRTLTRSIKRARNIAFLPFSES